jgi:DNA-directed RNA polymerase II subunit RPB1
MELDEEFETLCKDRVELRQILKNRGDDRENDMSIYLPVNIDRLIWDTQREFRINLREPTTLHPRVVLSTVREICNEKLIVVRGDDPLSAEAQRNATRLLQILIRAKLSTKRVLQVYRLNEPSLEWLKGQIVSAFHAAIVNPGEMAGVIAAQSLGQLVTQMTLNTFHRYYLIGQTIHTY